MADHVVGDEVEDELIDQVASYVMSNEYPDDASEYKKRVTGRKAKKFLAIKGELFSNKVQQSTRFGYTLISMNDFGVVGREASKICCFKNERNRILHACHVDPTAGHQGKSRTIYRIKERYIWHGCNGNG